MSRNGPIMTLAPSMNVAPREGRVSRNIFHMETEKGRENVAPREGRVSRNQGPAKRVRLSLVAPREGRVSRNRLFAPW